MVTRREIEIYYAEKVNHIPKDSENFEVPKYIEDYFDGPWASLREDENKQLYYSYYEATEQPRRYATFEEIIDHIRKLLDIDIDVLKKLREV